LPLHTRQTRPGKWKALLPLTLLLLALTVIVVVWRSGGA
jgi:NADH:ubiquinone oxidoreductase subunit H